MKIKKSLTLLILSLLIFFHTVSQGFAFQYEQKVSDKMRVIFPKNLSLLHILVMISPYGNEEEGSFTHPLAKKAREYFEPHKDHPAVVTTYKLIKQYRYNLFNYVAFYITDLPDVQIRKDVTLPLGYLNYMNRTDSYSKDVLNFYETANFEGFWKKYQGEFQSIVERCAESISPFNFPSLLENFYGESFKQYYFAPCPFMMHLIRRAEVPDKSGDVTVYYLAGPDFFSEKEKYISYAFHEFSHSFIEPIAKKFSGRIKRLRYLYGPMKNELAQLGYMSWYGGFIEHLTRAAQVFFMKEIFGEETGERTAAEQKKLGFKLIDVFYSAFETYNRSRQQFPNFESFFPHLLTEIERIEK